MKSAYAEAAWVLDELAARRGSLRALVHAAAVTQTRQVFALVCQTLKYRAALDEAIHRAGLLDAAPRLAARPSAALVIVYDLLLGAGVRGRGSWQQDVLRHADAVQRAWSDLMQERGATSPLDLLPEDVRNPPWIPRWARVNRLRRSVKDVLGRLRESGYAVLPTATTSLDEIAAAAQTGDLPERWVWQHDLLPEVLALPPTAVLLDDHPDLLQDGSLVLQDLASCMPAYALSVDRAVAHVVDACAAPGNKTSCLAALMRNAGRITACDVDGQRLDLLVRLTGRAGATNIEPWHGSFLDLDPASDDVADVTHILVDPSCSGSGIVSRRLEDLGLAPRAVAAATADPEEADEAAIGTVTGGRLQALADFQVAAVCHAMAFPAVQRISYSTCSVHEEENEDVVQRILGEQPDFTLVPAIPAWPRRGLPKFPGAELCVRTDPRLDHTIGFFLAVFERRPGPPGDQDHAAATEGTTSKKKKKKKKKRSHGTGDAAAPEEDGAPATAKRRRQQL